jgi:predicted PurR-regulated permease PerM
MDISKWQWNRVIVVALVILFFFFSAPIYLLVIFALILSMLLLSPVKWLERKMEPLSILSRKSPKSGSLYFFCHVYRFTIGGNFLFCISPISS